MIRQFDFNKMPIVEVVNELILDSAKRGASDIHCDPSEASMKIRIRVDGLLSDYAEVPNEFKKNLTTRIKILAGMNITESRLPQDGAIKTNLKGVDLDLRVSCLPITYGEKIVIRILDYTMSLSGLDQLGFSAKNYKKVLKMIYEPNGIILVTGATGSGKSTTVYSMLQSLNKEDTNIISVEDPVEMDVTGINQVQTNSEIGLTFASALRSILRQDPNVIMIGEIRDSETAKIAVRASITGHLVLSTIHTNNSLSTIERLIDMDVEKYLLASSLTGIISQKLARRLCPHCREKRTTNVYEKTLLKKILGIDVNELYVANGCEECSGGYSGRVSIHEVLEINGQIKEALSNDLPKNKMRELVYKKSGVTTMLQDGLEKVVSGDTTLEEILKLIELDDDENLTTSSDLKDAIEDSNLTQEMTESFENYSEKLENTSNESKVEPVIETITEATPEIVEEVIEQPKKSIEIESLLSDTIKPTVPSNEADDNKDEVLINSYMGLNDLLNKSNKDLNQ